MPRVSVDIVGDAESLLRALKKSVSGFGSFDHALKASTAEARASASAKVSAVVKLDESLRAQVTAYREVAAAAEKGSKEQLVAARLADRAQVSLSRSFGVTARESRSLARSSAGVERGLGRATRGALAGSGVFRGLGRSIAFASGGFLAFASAGQFLRTSIDAAKDAAVTQKQLAAQFRASGKDLGAYQKQIDETNLKLSALSGFTKDDLDKSFTTIFRTTGNVSKSLRDTATAADFARARHISLAQASLVLAKAEVGNTTLLRRAGFAIAKTATAEQALALVRAKVAGQAKAGTTQQERFGAVLHDSEVIIGAGLLPTLNKYLLSGAKWLTQMNESGRLQRDVSSAANSFSHAISDASSVLHAVKGVISGVDGVTGSFENTLKATADVWLVLKARTLAIKWGLIAAGETTVGTAATAAAGEVGLLEGSLLRLSKLGPIAVAIALNFIPRAAPSKNPNAPSRNPVAKYFANLPVVGPAFSQANRLSDFLNGKLGLIPNGSQGKPLNPFSPNRFGTGDLGLGALLAPKTAAKEFAAAAKAAPRGSSLQGKFNLLELRKANAEQSNNQKVVRAILVSEQAILKTQEASATKLKDRTAFAQALSSVMGEIRGIDQADANTAKQAAGDAKQRRDEEKKRLQTAIQARQFRALGLDATGSPITPAAKALRRELGTIDKAITGTILDTHKTQSVLSKIRRVLSGGLGAVTKDVRAQIKSMLDDIDQQLKDRGGSPATKAQKINSKTFFAGLGLDPATLRAARARLSQATTAGTVSSGPRAAFAGGFGGVPIIIQHTTTLDGKVVEQSVTRHQQKRRSKNSSQRRGPHAGGGI